MRSVTLLILVVLSVALQACATGDLGLVKHGKESFATGHYSRALEQLSMPAIHGNRDAQYALGYMYFYGKGVRRDVNLARAWFLKAAAAGHEKAIQALQMIDHPIWTKVKKQGSHR